MMKKISFNAKIIIVTVLLLIIGQIVNGLLSKSTSEKYLEQQYKAQAQIMAEQFVPLLQNKDNLDFQALLEEYKTIDGIEYILFTDVNSKILGHSDGTSRIEELNGNLKDDIAINKALQGEEYTSRYYREKTDTWVFDSSVPIRNNGEIIGAINIGLNMNKYFDSSKHISKNIILSIVISSLITSIK